jgi:HK97 family phage portal protein
MGLKDWLSRNTKASATTGAIVRFFSGQAVWTPRNYENLANEGFMQNVWVYRCVMAIAQAGAGVEWNLYSKRGKKKEEIEDHPLLNLLYRPNETQSKQEFIESILAFGLLSGNIYIEKNGPNDGRVTELWPLRSDRMTITPGNVLGLVSKYTYTVGAQQVYFEPQKVMHLKTFHPLNDLYGFSPIEAGARGIDNDNLASTWNNSLLNNGARPSGAMVTPSTLGEPQYDRLKDELNTAYKGASNAGRFMLLEGGLDWKEMGLSPRDMDFIESKKMSRLEICTAFGVPPEIIGVGEQKTYANYAEARKAFYMDTVLPHLDRIRDKFNSELAPLFGEGLYLDYDKDTIEALQENNNDKATRIRADVQAGLITVNEGRSELGYETLKDGDVLYIPNTLRVVNDKGEIIYQPTPPPQQQPLNDPNKDGQKHFFMKAFNLESDEQKTDFWHSMEKRRETYYKTVTMQIQKYFKNEQKAILKAFESDGIKGIEDTVKTQMKEFAKVIEAVNQMVIQDFGQATFDQLKNEATDLEIKIFKELFNVFAKNVQGWIKNNVAQKVVLVSDTTVKLLKNIVDIGQENGESIPQIAQRIDELYLDQIIPNRSTVIARTEVISSSNAGNHFSAEQTGLDLQKEWVSTKDDRTRDAHEEVNGQIRDMNKPYDVMGEPLQFPGDPNGSAKNIIQCRCTEIYKVKK